MNLTALFFVHIGTPLSVRRTASQAAPLLVVLGFCLLVCVAQGACIEGMGEPWWMVGQSCLPNSLLSQGYGRHPCIVTLPFYCHLHRAPLQTQPKSLVPCCNHTAEQYDEVPAPSDASPQHADPGKGAHTDRSHHKGYGSCKKSKAHHPDYYPHVHQPEHSHSDYHTYKPESTYEPGVAHQPGHGSYAPDSYGPDSHAPVSYAPHSNYGPDKGEWVNPDHPYDSYGHKPHRPYDGDSHKPHQPWRGVCRQPRGP